MNTDTILDENSTPFYPSNEDYHELHNAHIDQNIDDITALGSKYAVPLLNNITNTQLMEYKDETSSRKYGEFIKFVHSYVIIRSNDSIRTFENLMEEKSPRPNTSNSCSFEFLSWGLCFSYHFLVL